MAEVAGAPRDERPLVLIVEDGEDAMQILCELLVHHGFRVIGASNGAEALLRANEMQPDAVLLDLSLPILDGCNVASALRANRVTASIPIIVLTAHATGPEHARARAAGCDQLFVKPTPHDRLVLELRTLTNRHARRRGRTSPAPA